MKKKIFSVRKPIFNARIFSLLGTKERNITLYIPGKKFQPPTHKICF